MLRAGDHAGALALVRRSDVDDQQLGIRAHLLGRVPPDPRAGLGDHVVYPRNCGSTFSPKSRICSCRSAPHSSSITCVQPASRYSSIASMQSDGVPAIGRHLSRSASETCGLRREPPALLHRLGDWTDLVLLDPARGRAACRPRPGCSAPCSRGTCPRSRARRRGRRRGRDSWIEATTVQPTSISPPTFSARVADEVGRRDRRREAAVGDLARELLHLRRGRGDVDRRHLARRVRVGRQRRHVGAPRVAVVVEPLAARARRARSSPRRASARASSSSASSCC